MSKRRRPTIDRAVNDALIALYGPATGPPRPTVPHDKYGRCWPNQSKILDVKDIDAIITRYLNEDPPRPAVADWYRRLKTYGGDRRLMIETERLTPAVPHRQTEGD